MNKTESQVRNRYMRIIKGQNLIGINKCKKCNMIKKGHNCIYPLTVLSADWLFIFGTT